MIIVQYREMQKEQIKLAYDRLTEQRSSSRLAHFVRDKDVIIVGPDTALEGLGFGSKIEKYDAVARINTALNYVPFKKSLQLDVGERTDIFYLAPSSIKWAGRQETAKLTRRLVKSKNKFICYQNGNTDCKYMSGAYVFREPKAKLKELVLGNRKKGVETQLSSADESCRALCDILTEMKGESMVTRTGLLAIWDLLVHGASTVTVMGMSFYHGGGHMFRVIPDDKPLDPHLNHKHEKSPHDSFVEVRFLKELMDLFPGRIILEVPLTTLFDKIIEDSSGPSKIEKSLL